MLNDYGTLVKRVEDDVELERQKQLEQLENRRAELRERRKGEIEEKKRQKEGELNKEMLDTRN